LRLERPPLQRGEIDPVEYWGSSGTWLTLFEISQVFRSMRQCEIQARQVSGQEPDFSKMTNLAGKKPLLVFFNSQTGGTGVTQDGDSRWHSGSARPGWAVLGLNATRLSVTWPAARYNGLDRGNFVTSRYVGSRPPCIAADFLATMMNDGSDAVIVPREV